MAAIGKASHTTQWIPVKSLSVIWVQSQRKLDPKWVQQLADEFDADLFGIISVTQPNDEGIHHVIDGQHRVDLILRNYGEEEKVPCHVFDAADPARAAQLFNKINTSRRKPQNIDIFRVRVTAGDEVEVAVNKIVRSLGYKIDWAKRDGNIAAVEALTSVYRKHGGDVLRYALNLIKATWGLNADATVAPIIRGYGAFVAEFGADAKWERMVDRVAKKFSPGHMLGTARSLREGLQCSTDEAVKRVLINAYNQGLRGNGATRPLNGRAADHQAA